MSRRTMVIKTDEDRQRIAAWARNVDEGTIVEFKSARRSTDQNALMWVLLGEIAQQVDWYGQKLLAEDWKDVLTASLRRARVVPGVDPGTFVPLGMRTSDMTPAEFSELIELIYAFGAQQGVVFSQDVRGAPA